MGNAPPPQDLDPKTLLRIAIKRSKYKTLLAREAETALWEMMTMILEDEDVPEPMKDAARERYEEYGLRRDELVCRQLAECERLLGGSGRN